MVLSVRNNNPGNLRAVGRNEGFQQFASAQEGLEAMRNDLRVKVTGQSGAMRSAYGEGYKPTLRNLVSVYAPPSENDTNKYVSFVAQKSGLNPDQPLSETDIDKFMPAMVEMEGGQEAVKHFFGSEQAAPTQGAPDKAAYLQKLKRLKELRDMKAQASQNAAPSATEEPQRKTFGQKAADFIGFVKQFDPNPVNQVKRAYNAITNPASRERAALDQGIQGLTASWGDEVTDRMGAGIAAIATDQPYSELLKEARLTTEENLNRQVENYPVTSTISNLVGSGVTAGAVASKIPVVGNTIRTGLLPNATSTAGKAANLATKAIAGGSAGAASGAVIGAGAAEDGKKSEGATTGAVIGGAVGALAPVVIDAGSKLNRALGKKSPVPNADQLRAKASKLYKTASEKGGVLKADFTNKFVDEIEKLKPQTEIGKIVGGDSAFTKAIEKIAGVVDDEGKLVGGIRGKPISLEAAQELDELLGDAIDGFTDSGRLTKQGKKLLDIQSTFRNMIEEADESLIEGGKDGFNALKDARKLWATSRKLADIERIIERAKQMDNPATGIKSGFRTLYNNPTRLKGFNKAEREAIKRAAESGEVTDLLRTAGSKLLSIAATVKGGPAAGAVTYGASSLAKSAATKVQVSKAQKITDLIANQGPVQQRPLIAVGRKPNALVATNPLVSISQQ
jgi:hypothetical protein